MLNKQTKEDYLKSVLILHQKNGQARAVDVAKELGVTKPSVSAAMKSLCEMKLVFKDEKSGIRLTKAGKKLAEQVVNKHTLIKNILIRIGVSEKTADEEACQIEHVIGEETYRCLEEVYERGETPIGAEKQMNDPERIGT